MRRRSVKTPLKPFLVTTKDDAEFQYFLQMKKDCRYKNMIVEKVDAKDLYDMIIKTQKLKLQNKYKQAWAVCSLSQYSKKANEIEEELKFAEVRRINIAYADPSILLYFALHFEDVQPNATDSTLTSIIKRYIPTFKWTGEYLTSQEGSTFNLTLFKDKAKAGAREGNLTRLLQITNPNASQINFMRFMNDVAEFCGEGDIAYNQRTIG